MKNIFNVAFAFFLILACLTQASATSDPWLQGLEKRISNMGLKYSYPRRLLFPKLDRKPTNALTTADNGIILVNILHDGKLFKGMVKPENIVKAEILNVPIAPRAFHFGTIFHFKDGGIKIVDKNNNEEKIKAIVMSTGPEMAPDLRAIIGFQLIQTKTLSLEEYTRAKPLKKKFRHTIDTKKISIEKFFLAYAEESARLYAMTNLRALRGERPELGDKIIFQKYNVFGQNCIASGIQNLTRAVRKKYAEYFSKLSANRLKKVTFFDELQFRYYIYTWFQLSQIALEGILGDEITEHKLKMLEKFHRNLRSKNSLSLPWHAKKLIDWATIN